MSGAADGVPEGGVSAVPDHRHDGDGTMTTAMAMPGNTAATFLTHFFGSGLADERYVVERFKAMADGDIRPWPADDSATKKGRKARRVTATLKAVSPSWHFFGLTGPDRGMFSASKHNILGSVMA